MADDDTRRHLKRRHLVYYLRVFDQSTNELVGHLVDITTEGVKLVRETPVNPGASHRLSMQLPARLEGSYDVRFAAECLWCRPDENPSFFVAGFHITGAAKRDLDLITELVNEFGFNE